MGKSNFVSLHCRKGLQTPVHSTFSSRGLRTIQIIEIVDSIQIFASVHLLLLLDHPRYLSALRKGFFSDIFLPPYACQTFLDAALSRVMRAAVPIPAVAHASVSHSAAFGGSVVGVVGLL